MIGICVDGIYHKFQRNNRQLHRNCMSWDTFLAGEHCSFFGYKIVRIMIIGDLNKTWNRWTYFKFVYKSNLNDRLTSFWTIQTTTHYAEKQPNSSHDDIKDKNAEIIVNFLVDHDWLLFSMLKLVRVPLFSHSVLVFWNARAAKERDLRKAKKMCCCSCCCCYIFVFLCYCS